MGLIDRENLINQMESHIYWGDSAVGLLEVAKAAPTIEAEPVRHGEWVGIEFNGYADGCPVYDLWECSECGHEHKGESDTLTDYCPDCGTKMDGGVDNDCI